MKVSNVVGGLATTGFEFGIQIGDSGPGVIGNIRTGVAHGY